MENLINELCRTFFQQLPNGLCLIFAIGVVVSLVFILPKRKHHNPLYAAFWVGILLMVVWRLIVGLVAVRYVSVLIIPAVMMTAFVGFRAESWWRWLCRRYRFLPRFIGKMAPWLLIYGCSAGALAMAIYNCYAGQEFYLVSYEIIREYMKKEPAVKVLTQENERHRTSYYTGVATLGLKENSREEVRKFLNSVEANRTLLVIMRDRKKYSRITFAPEELLPGAKWELYRRVRRSSGKERRNKELNVYVYTPPARAVPCAGALPLSSRKGNLIGNAGFEKSFAQKQALALIPQSYRKDSFYHSAGFQLPAGDFQVAGALKDKEIPLVKSLSGKEALRGKTSLSVVPKGKNAVNFWVHRNLAPGSYTLEFFVRGKKGSVVEVLSYGGKKQKKELTKHLYFKLPDEQLYHCSTVVSFSQASFMAGIRVSGGGLLLDELFLAPAGVK